MDRAWVEEIPSDFQAMLEAQGYPDITFFLIELREFLQFVEDSVRGSFAAR